MSLYVASIPRDHQSMPTARGSWRPPNREPVDPAFHAGGLSRADIRHKAIWLLWLTAITLERMRVPRRIDGTPCMGQSTNCVTRLNTKHVVNVNLRSHRPCRRETSNLEIFLSSRYGKSMALMDAQMTVLMPGLSIKCRPRCCDMERAESFIEAGSMLKCALIMELAHPCVCSSHLCMPGATRPQSVACHRIGFIRPE